MSEHEKQEAGEQPNTDSPESKSGGACPINSEMCQDVMQSLKQIDYQGLFARIELIVTKPQQAWGVIKDEKLSIKEIYIQHLVVLMALGAICTFIKQSIIGYSTLVGTIRQGFFSGLVHMVLGFALMLVIVYLSALLLEFVGKLEVFGSKAQRESFFKLVAYSMIPGLLGNIVAIVPFVGWLLSIALALYGIYVMYLGVEPMTGITKKIPYLAASVFATIILLVLLFGILSTLLPMPAPQMPALPR